MKASCLELRIGAHIIPINGMLLQSVHLSISEVVGFQLKGEIRLGGVVNRAFLSESVKTASGEGRCNTGNSASCTLTRDSDAHVRDLGVGAKTGEVCGLQDKG